VIEAIVVTVWLVPMVLMTMAVVGYMRARTRRLGDPPTLLIIQVTTIGSHSTVNRIIDTIRGCELADIPYQIWIVTEPGSGDGYVGADRVVVVPAAFVCKAQFKARALEYTRRIRATEGIVGQDVKILFIDDDSTPTESYIRKSALLDADICEGVVVPRTDYGRFLSHLDDLRTLNCLFFCSIFQGFGHPIEVHGEGMCVRASAEHLVTWNYPIFASEDLVFGHMAAAKGLRWAFFHDWVTISSPWTWKDHIRQRRRWLWGNLWAVRHVLPVRSKIMLTAKYLFGFSTFFLAVTGIILKWCRLLAIPDALLPLLYASFGLWIIGFAGSGWINSGGRLRPTIGAVILAYVTSGTLILVLLITLFQGNPRTFEVIAKERPAGVGAE